MSENIKNLKGPIENVLLSLGLVLFTLGCLAIINTITFVVDGYYYDKGFPWIIYTSLLLGIGSSLVYLVRMSKKIE